MDMTQPALAPGRQRLEIDAHDRLAMRTAHLSALLHIIMGEGCDHFQNLGEQLQNDALWLASSLADEIDEIVKSCAAMPVG
jgi:hypothetical protein